MDGSSFRARCVLSVLVASASFVFVDPTRADSKPVDLDAVAVNGDESQCELYISNPFPVEFTNKVTNKTGGDAFDFSWPSAGPGGFTSSVIAGTALGKSSAWTWTTFDTVVSTTGSTCANDICFTQTSGPDAEPGTKYCAYACLADASSLAIAKAAPALSWTGGQSPFTVYRSTSKIGVVASANALGATTSLNYADPTTPAPGVTFFYAVRGLDCGTRKTCVTNANCSNPGDGACVTRGPFGVPGRKLANEIGDVTISSGTLSASLIQFFSPGKELFKAESFANAGGFAERLTNYGLDEISATTAAVPAGCCPLNLDVPHQLRCGATCVDYLNDPNNCGGCGTECGDAACCSNGSCKSLCGEGQRWCDGQCADLRNDSNNCGECGTVCGDGTCCSNGICESLCPAGQVWCNNQCVDVQNDSSSCGNCDYGCDEGTCDYACGDGTCCNHGACESFCPDGQALCGEDCADFQNDSAHCGNCDTACGAGTCCNGGTCESFCPEGQVLCGSQCVDFQNDNDNCGTCGHACAEGSCCSDGTCASLCPVGQVLCGTQCVDVQNDNDNCGACSNACGDGSCCNGGTCASLCEVGRTFCDGLCYDTNKDPANCGACGIVCAADSICTGGACVPCDGHGGADDACDNRCTNTNTDPYNCGACGVSCNVGCPSGFKGVCSNGQSCRCVVGTPAPQPPSDIPPPTEPFCPNPNPPLDPVPGVCPNPHPSSPIPGFCPNPTPTTSVPGFCHNPTPSSPAPGYCPNPHPSTGTVPGVCPAPVPPGPAVDDTAVCVVNETTKTIPGCTEPPCPDVTVCHQGGVLFKEVPTAIIVCGNGIPGVDGECNESASKVTTGTFNRLVPDPTKTVGNAYVTPFAVHLVSDTSGDGVLQFGESGELVIDVVNAGPMTITGASATLSAPAVDLSDDGVVNPVGITVGTLSSAYGTILGTPVSTDCTAPPPQPASNASVFPITVPSNHPGDTAHPFVLAVSGTVNGGPFAMNVPLVLGIAHGCNAAAQLREFDGLDGLSSPMAKLVPVGEPVPFPSKSFSAGNSRPMKLRVSCGGVNLTDAMVDPPEIVGLSEATRGELNIHLLNLNEDNGTNPNDPFFRFNNTLSGGQWSYNMRTSLLGTGSFTLKIRIAGRKNYVTGFVLQ